MKRINVSENKTNGTSCLHNVIVKKLNRYYFQTLFHLVTTGWAQCLGLGRMKKERRQPRQVICLALLHDRENPIHLGLGIA